MVKLSIDEKHIIVNNKQAISLSTFTEIDPLSELSALNCILIIDNWVVKAGRRLFWLPPSFRPANQNTITMNDNTIIIGTETGRFVIISLIAHSKAQDADIVLQDPILTDGSSVEQQRV
ncbi:hypothetical protein BDQ17DRAFT_1374180 [Cyathus striatus]|nr:hypothetical protein BDQ17DRAFT_1374180 [Cyathus striatus]